MRNEERRGLGRAEGHSHSRNTKILDYLAFISEKYEVDLERLFDGIVEAWRQQRSVCGDLLIECRGSFLDQAVFLITKAGKVITQFRLPEHILREGDLLREYMPDMRLHSSSWKKFKATHS